MATMETYPTEAIRPEESRFAFIKRISWGAIIAGVVVALVVQIALSVLGLAVGASKIEPLTQENPFSGMGTGAGIWFGISTLIALFCGGSVAGRLAGVPRSTDGLLHGLLTWGVTTLLTLYLLTTAVGGFISGAAGMLSQGIQLASQGASKAPGDNVTEAVKSTLKGAGVNVDPLLNDVKKVSQNTDPATQNELASTITGIATSGKPAFDQADRDKLEGILTTNAGMSAGQARSMVDRWDQQYQQIAAQVGQAKQKTEQEVRQAGDVAARTISQAALWTFIGFLFGAIAASVGGWLSRPRDIVETRATVPVHTTGPATARR